MEKLRFGEQEWVALWRVKGSPSAREANDLGRAIAEAIGMEVVSSAVDLFPHSSNGKGGVGLQAYWAWTESFLVISTWPELGIFRVYLASCKRFESSIVIDEISKYGIPIAFELTEI